MTHSGICTILYPETGKAINIDYDLKVPALGKVAYEVQRQQKLIWPDSARYNTTQAMSLKLFPVSDFMNEDLLIDTYQMPLMFQLNIGNYYDAIVDYISTFAVGGGNWTKVCNAASFELYDVFYHIKKLYLRPEAMPFIQQERVRKIEIPFVRCHHGYAPFPASQAQMPLSIQNYQNVQNLERIVLCFIHISYTSNTALNDRLCLRNGSYYDIKVDGGGNGAG